MRRGRFICAWLIAMLPAPALAQAYQCAIPANPPAVPSVERDGPARIRQVTGYTLALSWSPQYCRFREQGGRDQRQCSGRNGRFGFVVHGLWPEGRGGDWPQWCPVRRALTPREMSRNLCMTPSQSLLAHEWAKHGSCMSYRPESYFRITRILWNSFAWPDYDRLARRDELTAGEVREAFARANPGWDEHHIGLKLDSRGWLEEMRLCYGKDFMPVRCDRRRFGPGNEAPVRIWRGL